MLQTFVEIFAGMILAVFLILIAKLSKNYRREKIIYAIGLAIAAFIYVGFGIFSNSNSWIITEFVGVLIYLPFAVLGVRFSGWFLSLGWILHVAWDLVLHSHTLSFVPSFYPLVCLGFDVLIAFYIAFREIYSKKLQ